MNLPWQYKLGNTENGIYYPEVKCGSLNRIGIKPIYELQEAIVPSQNEPLFIIDYMIVTSRPDFLPRIIATDGKNYCKLKGYGPDKYLLIYEPDFDPPEANRINLIIHSYLNKIMSL